MVFLVFYAGLSLSIGVLWDRNGKDWRHSLGPWDEAPPQHSHTLFSVSPPLPPPLPL